MYTAIGIIHASLYVSKISSSYGFMSVLQKQRLNTLHAKESPLTVGCANAHICIENTFKSYS